jgi:uncharacterized FlgJ-related protein
MEKTLIGKAMYIMANSILIGIIVGMFIEKPKIVYVDKVILVYEHDLFNEDKLINEITSIKIKFPHIVYAQSILESNRGFSHIAVQNNNLFGMKNSFSRATTANGSSMGYACYNTWKDSLYDYALYQSSYTRHIKTEDDYFNHLKSSYASDPFYVNKLKYIIETNKLKELFKNLKS